MNRPRLFYSTCNQVLPSSLRQCRSNPAPLDSQAKLGISLEMSRIGTAGRSIRKFP